MITNFDRRATQLSIAMIGVESDSVPLAKIAKFLNYRQIENNRASLNSPLKYLVAINFFKDQKAWNQIIAHRGGWKQNLHRHRFLLRILNYSQQLAVVYVNVRNVHVLKFALLSKDEPPSTPDLTRDSGPASAKDRLCGKLFR